MNTQTGIDDHLVGVAEERIPNLFLLINIVIRRSEQVMGGGASPLQDWTVGPIEVALREIVEERLVPDDEGDVWTVDSHG